MKMIDGSSREQKRILEINPKHPFVMNLNKLALVEPGSARVTAWSEMLYEEALLAEGVVSDPAALVKRIQDLLTEVSSAAP